LASSAKDRRSSVLRPLSRLPLKCATSKPLLQKLEEFLLTDPTVGNNRPSASPDLIERQRDRRLGDGAGDTVGHDPVGDLKFLYRVPRGRAKIQLLDHWQGVAASTARCPPLDDLLKLG
jgi:hypothetical protein